LYIKCPGNTYTVYDQVMVPWAS